MSLIKGGVRSNAAFCHKLQLQLKRTPITHGYVVIQLLVKLLSNL